MTVLQVDDLPSGKFSALKRKARRMGLTPEKYVRELIEEDLALDEKAQTTTFAELTAGYRKALKGVSEEELDRMVDAARGRRRSGSRHKR